MSRQIGAGTYASEKPWSARVARERSAHPRHHELLDAAETVFVRLGYDRTTVAEITAQADVSRATFYFYFASKEEIFAALAARVREALFAVQEVPGRPDSPQAFPHDTIRAASQATRTHGALLRLIDRQRGDDPRIAAIYADMRDRPIARFATFLHRITEAGQARPAAPLEVTAEALVTALIYGILARLDDAPSTIDSFVDDMITLYETSICFTGHAPKSRERLS
jgi:AcrR family transcriptional regulator